MTLAELSAATGVSVATIKYYIREGLLPAGEPIGPKKAEYDESHVARIRLIRILREVGDVPVARIGEVVAALSDQDAAFHDVSGRSFHALGPFATLPDTAAARAARRDVLEYLSEADWIDRRRDGPRHRRPRRDTSGRQDVLGPSSLTGGVQQVPCRARRPDPRRPSDDSRSTRHGDIHLADSRRHRAVGQGHDRVATPRPRGQESTPLHLAPIRPWSDAISLCE